MSVMCKLGVLSVVVFSTSLFALEPIAGHPVPYSPISLVQSSKSFDVHKIAEKLIKKLTNGQGTLKTDACSIRHAIKSVPKIMKRGESDRQRIAVAFFFKQKSFIADPLKRIALAPYLKIPHKLSVQDYLDDGLKVQELIYCTASCAGQDRCYVNLGNRQLTSLVGLSYVCDRLAQQGKKMWLLDINGNQLTSLNGLPADQVAYLKIDKKYFG